MIKINYNTLRLKFKMRQIPRYLILIFIIFSFTSKVFAEFEKEVQLTDQGKCEEALAENERTRIEQNKKFSSKNIFNGKHTLKLFEGYRLNRKVGILWTNCKKHIRKL